MKYLFTLIASTCIALGQGALTPPGAPGETQRSLQEIYDSTITGYAGKPLIDSTEGVSSNGLTTLTTTITESGSYFLNRDLQTRTFVSPPVWGIRVQADNVTIDLKGHTISTTGSTGPAILIEGNNVTIKNGKIVCGSTYSGGSFAASESYQGGILADSSYDNIKVENVLVQGVDGKGISLLGQNTTVSSCKVNICSSDGITAYYVNESDVTLAGGHGIYGISTVRESIGKSYGSGAGIYSYNVYASTGTSSEGIGIWSLNNVIDSTGISSGTDAGHGILAESIIGSYGSANYGIGLSALTVKDSRGTSTLNHAIEAADSVSGSLGVSTGGAGIVAARVTDSTGEGNFIGIDASSMVQNSRGLTDGIASASGIGIRCLGGSVIGSTGISTNVAGGSGISAETVTNSFGQSAGADGIYASSQVKGSKGETTGAGSDANGIDAPIVTDSSGSSFAEDGGYGIECSTSGLCSNSRGFSTSSTASAIRAGTVVSSIGAGTNAAIDATNTYDMP